MLFLSVYAYLVLMDIETWLRAVGDLVMPRTCLVCGRRLGLHEAYLCIRCAADLPLTWYWGRRHHPMADRFNAVVERHRGGEYVPYIYAAALLFYQEDYRQVPWALKYRGDLGAGQHFARMLGERMAAASYWSDVDLVVPVPLHWTRHYLRGYNQAEVIAREMAVCLGAPLRTDILVRTRRTRTQTRLSGEEKARNVDSAFQVRRSIFAGQSSHAFFPLENILPGKPSPLSTARHILLVDDTFTTGATLYACYKALRSVTSSRISIATLSVVGA